MIRKNSRKEGRTLEIIRVGIMLPDKMFAGALVRGLSRECRNMAFLLEQPEYADLILTDEVCPQEYQKDRFLYLVNEPSRAEERVDLVFRYEDCRSIVNRLTHLYYLLTGRNLEYRGTTAFRVISFLGEAGGCGVTSLCLSVGRMLSILYGCHCLYLSLTPLDGSGQYVGYSEGGDLQRLFYQLEAGKEVPLGAHLLSDGYLDRLRVPMLNHYLTEIDGQVLASLMETVNRMGQYEYVLIDIGTMYAGGVIDLLRNSDGYVFVRNGSRYMEEERADHLIGTLGISETKGIRVRNMVRGKEETYDDEMQIRYCRQAFVWRDGRIEIDLNTSYGSEVAMLCERILGEYDNGK